MKLPYIMAKDTITVMVNGTATTVREGQANFQALRDAIRAQEWDRVPDLVTPAKAIEAFAVGRVTVRDGEVLLDGEVIHNAVTRRIMEMVTEGFDADPLMRFLERLMQNPSHTAVNELYLWLEGTQLPITEDGQPIGFDGETVDGVGGEDPILDPDTGAWVDPVTGQPVPVADPGAGEAEMGEPIVEDPIEEPVPSPEVSAPTEVPGDPGAAETP